MAFEKTTEIQPIASLPVADHAMQLAARDIALLSQGLIASNDAPLLAVAVPSDAWDTRSPVILWDQRLSVCERRRRAVCETAMFGPALDALCIAADTLFERLHAWGWTHADAGRLCAVTDGTGVVLIADRPDGGPGWLLDMAAPGGHAALLPLAGDGVWALIAAESRRASFH